MLVRTSRLYKYINKKVEEQIQKRLQDQELRLTQDFQMRLSLKDLEIKRLENLIDEKK